jgi:hypothetical protein
LPSPEKSIQFRLKFNYAARKNGVCSPHTSQGNVLWNGKVIGRLNPSDYSVKTATFHVQVKAGTNTLQFEGTSSSDHYGLNIDNVQLSSPHNNWQNIISNGGFEDPCTGSGWKQFNGGIPHWAAHRAEVGNCHIVYNSNWPVSSGQCIELDSNSNQKYTQTINVQPATLDHWIKIKNGRKPKANKKSPLSCVHKILKKLRC